MLSLASFSPGRRFHIQYPAHNRLDVPIEMVRRHIEVLDVFDARRKSIWLDWFVERPFIRRGSVLIVARDLDLGEVRRYWWEAIGGRRKLPSYRVGVYDPGHPGEMVDWVSRAFAPTVDDRLAMLDRLVCYREMMAAECSRLRLAAYPVEG
jgi:hypothetical protein